MIILIDCLTNQNLNHSYNFIIFLLKSSEYSRNGRINILTMQRKKYTPLPNCNINPDDIYIHESKSITWRRYYEPAVINKKFIYSGLVEIILVRGFYFLYFLKDLLFRYTVVRNMFGSEAVSAEYAHNNALKVVNFEKFFHFFIEQNIQVYIYHHYYICNRIISLNIHH